LPLSLENLTFVSATVTKAATRRAVEKPTKAGTSCFCIDSVCVHKILVIAAKADKPKRPPSAYNLFVQANMKPWLEANKDRSVKEAMAEVRI
jgi:hypothetical protein